MQSPATTLQTVLDWAYLTVDTDCDLIGRLRRAADEIGGKVAEVLEVVIADILEIENNRV